MMLGYPSIGSVSAPSSGFLVGNLVSTLMSETFGRVMDEKRFGMVEEITTRLAVVTVRWR